MWIFSNSTWKGQLKNVQDGKSRPLGSRDIQKTKVETVLRDTLYNHHPLKVMTLYFVLKLQIPFVYTLDDLWTKVCTRLTTY